jgi:hypothetical protein
LHSRVPTNDSYGDAAVNPKNNMVVRSNTDKLERTSIAENRKQFVEQGSHVHQYSDSALVCVCGGEYLL